MPEETNEQKNVEIQIKAEDNELKGRFANGLLITHTKNEFYFDFTHVIPNSGGHGFLAARILLTPEVAKKAAKAIEENLAKYESKFDEIETEV